MLHIDDQCVKKARLQEYVPPQPLEEPPVYLRKFVPWRNSDETIIQYNVMEFNVFFWTVVVLAI